MNIPIIEIDAIVLGGLFLLIVIITFLGMFIYNYFNPKELLSIIRHGNKLKQLDCSITRDLKRSGFITKFIFRTFSKGAERFF